MELSGGVAAVGGNDVLNFVLIHITCTCTCIYMYMYIQCTCINQLVFGVSQARHTCTLYMYIYFACTCIT